jgi:hypothetical protein
LVVFCALAALYPYTLVGGVVRIPVVLGTANAEFVAHLRVLPCEGRPYDLEVAPLVRGFQATGDGYFTGVMPETLSTHRCSVRCHTALGVNRAIYCEGVTFSPEPGTYGNFADFNNQPGYTNTVTNVSLIVFVTCVSIALGTCSLCIALFRDKSWLTHPWRFVIAMYALEIFSIALRFLLIAPFLERNQPDFTMCFFFYFFSTAVSNVVVAFRSMSALRAHNIAPCDVSRFDDSTTAKNLLGGDDEDDDQTTLLPASTTSTATTNDG